MKKRIFLGLFTILVLSLGVVAFAFTTGVTTDKTAVSSCCKGDTCPMKKKDTAGKETASCCDKCDCCKGDSCPMKKNKDGSGTHTDHPSMSDHSKMDAATADAKTCDCSCCKGKDTKKDG